MKDNSSCGESVGYSKPLVMVFPVAIELAATGSIASDVESVTYDNIFEED